MRFNPRLALSLTLGVARARAVVEQNLSKPIVARVDAVEDAVYDGFFKGVIQGSHPSKHALLEPQRRRIIQQNQRSIA